MKAVVVGIFAMMALNILASPNLFALSAVVISQLQTGDTLAATNEAVELYNNATTDQDITNWCIRYSSANSQTFATSLRYCFTPPDEYTQILLASRSHASIVTSGYAMSGGQSPDGRFSGSGMASPGGHVRLIDSLEMPADVVGWGSAVYGEGYSLSNPAPPAPTASQALSRKALLDGLLQDTDDNRADFEIKPPLMRTGGVYEVRTPMDVCGNMPDIQETLPDGLGYDEAGNCVPLSADLCSNVADIQLVVPLGLLGAEDNTCHADVCLSLEGLQRIVPVGYRLDGSMCVELDNRELWLSELMPNISGNDSGKEFIELYNPHYEAVRLHGYKLLVGKNLESTYELDRDGALEIPARGFAVFGDDELGFTLLNTVNRIQLIAPAGNIVSETQYVQPADDESWALIGEEWQYTNRPTPSGTNLSSSSFVQEVEGVSTALTPCSAGKYRHPVTNRCRNIEADIAMLVACDTDEYRHPETNRCRKVAAQSAALVPCNSGYERNPETNRCRKVGGIDVSLSPCQVGYERNPATNRCRKTTSNVLPVANVASVVEAPSDSPLKHALIITAGLGAVGYGLYEWRSEIFRGVRRLVQLTSGK